MIPTAALIIGLQRPTFLKLAKYQAVFRRPVPFIRFQRLALILRPDPGILSGDAMGPDRSVGSLTGSGPTMYSVRSCGGSEARQSGLCGDFPES